MAEVTINYKDAAIATMDASGTKTLQTQGKYCEDDIEVVYARPSGGGSSPIQLLDTVTVPSDTRSVNIDTTPYNSYDFYFCIVDATLTESDWLYVVRDRQDPSGGTYQSQSISHHGLIFMVAKQYSDSDIYTYLLRLAAAAASSGQPTNIYIYTYVATKLIKAGSTFKIYGGNYADM